MVYYLFDPVQFKEYGGSFYTGADFYYRYIQTNKLFFKNIYIPFGPVCQTKEGFENFLNHLQTLRFCKIKIDLPMIYKKEITEGVVKNLKKFGFKKTNYILQDEETLLTFKENLKLDSKKRNIINYGNKFVDIIVKENLNQQELEDIYKIYLESAKRIGFGAKPKEMFTKLSENCLVSLAVGKQTEEIEGYVFGYFVNYGKTDFTTKDSNRILFNMFTGTTDTGREHKVGHTMYYELFTKAFEKYGVDFIDMRGASRTKNRPYLHFKREFSHNFYNLPGSFIRYNF